MNKTFETIPLQDGQEAEVEIINEVDDDEDEPVATKQDKDTSGLNKQNNSHIKMNGKDGRGEFKKIAEEINHLRNTNKL